MEVRSCAPPLYGNADASTGPYGRRRHHKNAAKSHRIAAKHHGKGDHSANHKHSTEAHGHSTKSHSKSGEHRKQTLTAHDRSRLKWAGLNNKTAL